MHNYQSKGRECFYYIVRKWPKIIVGAILIALAFGALRGFKTYRSWDQDKADIEDLHQRYEEYMGYYTPTLEMYNDSIAAKQESITQYYQQLCEAEVIRFDDNNTGIATATLFFSSTSDDELPADVASIFADVLVNSIDWSSVAEVGDTDENFIDKMLIISSVSETGNSLNLKYFASDEDAALDMLNSILSQAEDIKDDLSNQIDGFDYTILNSSSFIGRDEEYLSLRNDIQNQYNILQIELSDIYTAVEELEAPPELRDMPTKAQICKSIIKYCILGGAVGVVFFAAVFYLLFYLNGMLHSTEELAYYTGAQAIAYDSAKKRFAKINNLIASKENRGILYSDEETVARVVSNVKSMYPDASRVMFTGSKAIPESLQKCLKEAKNSGLSLCAANNVLTDKKALDSLLDCDTVVLVEELDKTSVELLKKEVEQFNISGKKVAGAVIVR